MNEIIGGIDISGDILMKYSIMVGTYKSLIEDSTLGRIRTRISLSNYKHTKDEDFDSAFSETTNRLYRLMALEDIVVHVQGSNVTITFYYVV